MAKYSSIGLALAVASVTVGALGGPPTGVGKPLNGPAVIAARGPAETAGAGPCVVERAARADGATLSFVRGASILLVSASGRRVSTVLRGSGRAGIGPGQGQEDLVWYYDPAWSADGRCLAYTSGGYPTGSHWYADVHVMHGSRTYDMPGGESSIDGSPSWDPTGRRVVLVGYEMPAGGGLYIQGVGSGSSTALTPAPFDPEFGDPVDDTPAWSGDGSSIAFTRSVNRISSLYTVRADGTDPRLVSGLAGNNPSWSPDGKRIAFDDGRRIAVVDSNGRHQRYLTRPGGINVDPAWSPDGRTIAYTHFQSVGATRGDIWMISPSGSHSRLFIRNATQPAWKPQQ